MKRCIVCGSIGDDDSTVCRVCGNPFIDLSDSSEKSASMDEMERQLEQVWSRVQEGELSDQQDRDDIAVTKEDLPDEPEVTVLSDPAESDSASSEKARTGDEVSREGDGTESAPVTETVQEEQTLPQPETERVPSTEESEKSSRQNTPEQPQLGTERERPAKEENTKSSRQNAPEQPQTETVSEPSARENVKPAQQRTQEPKQSTTEKNDQAASARQTSRPRRRSGPQIYGQDSMTEYKGTQGVIRRDVQAGSAAARRNTEYEKGTDTRPIRTADRRAARPETPEGSREGTRQFQESRMDREMSAQGRPAQRRDSQPGDRGTGQSANTLSQRQGTRQQGNTQPYAQVPQEDRQQEKGAFAVRKIMETSRALLTSPLLLFVAIFHTIYFAGAIAAIFMGELDYSLFGRLFGSLPLPDQLANYVSMLQSALAQLDNGAVAIDLALRVPDLLFFLGIWLLCITARASKERMSGAGFLFIRIAVVLNMIAACVLILAVLILSATVTIASGNTGISDSLPIKVAVLAAVIIAAMLIVMYYFCFLTTISALSRNARLGENYGKASAYVALVHIVFAFTAIINVLSGVLNGWIPVAAGGAARFLWMLLFGVWIFKYRNALREYNE
ncbi:MAG: hypothetical protein LIP12_13575 [Clostridiales bacterium]|nr:hypothetical protein [Clostridiales bacterium]